MKQELLDDLQRLLKCPKPKTECADRALLDGALNGWKDEAKVNGESMRDSLLDLANYAILTIMELDKTKK